MTSLPADDRQTGSLGLAVVMAILTAVALEMTALLFIGLAVKALGHPVRLPLGLALGLGSIAAWMVAGGVAYEVARQRRAAFAAGALPVVVSLAIACGAVFVTRASFDWQLLAGVLSGALLGLGAYGGARLWERHIRRHDALQ